MKSIRVSGSEQYEITDARYKRVVYHNRKTKGGPLSRPGYALFEPSVLRVVNSVTDDSVASFLISWLFGQC